MRSCRQSSGDNDAGGTRDDAPSRPTTAIVIRGAGTGMKEWDGFRSVLCPIDFSEHARLALRYAEAIAIRARGTLTVAYANDPLLVAAAAAALHDRHLAKRSATELRRFIDETLDPRSRHRARVKLAVSTGHPPDAIMKTADRIRPDVIVLGTHGLTGAGRLLLGSTTLSMLQRTTVPVLAVPRRDESASMNTAAWPGEGIVAALELDRDSPREVDTAARIARWFGSSLLLLHIVGDIPSPAWLKGDLSAHDRIRIAQAQQQIDGLAVAARSLVETDTRVTCGDPADEIAALVAAQRTGLLVTALRDRRGWFGSRRGSISYHVLSYTVAPVLACPPAWRPR
jgi:nucleotide-binding universal stress UspA family protein